MEKPELNFNENKYLNQLTPKERAFYLLHKSFPEFKYIQNPQQFLNQILINSVLYGDTNIRSLYHTRISLWAGANPNAKLTDGSLIFTHLLTKIVLMNHYEENPQTQKILQNKIHRHISYIKLLLKSNATPTLIDIYTGKSLIAILENDIQELDKSFFPPADRLIKLQNLNIILKLLKAAVKKQ